MEKNNRKEELVKLIKEAQDAYYNGENAIMSDKSFDELWDELTDIDPMNPILHKVGEDSGSVFAKAPHVLHMFSQQKCKTSEEFLDWFRKHPSNKYLVQHKLDGSSIELQYVNGKFNKAVTRGNGLIGDDVTQNFIDNPDIPKFIPGFTGGARGEVLLFHKDFKEHFTDKANCRNAANGIMKRKDNNDASKYLHIITYDIQSMDGSLVFKTETEKNSILEKYGFRVVPTLYTNDPNTIIKLRDSLGSSRFEDLEYDIDGLVIKCDLCDPEDVKRDRPDKQIAFKFSLDEAITTIRDVEWSVSGRSRTPVAICDPVRLCGTTVQRANLCNIDLIKSMNIKIGSKVVMVKRGEIIPKIERLFDNNSVSGEIPIPSICEYCGNKLTVTGTKITCDNPKCKSTVCHRIARWCEVHKIYGMGESSVEKLYDVGIKDIVDLYRNPNLEKILIDVLGENGRKIYPRIISTRKTTLQKVLQGFDMEYIGETISKLLTKGLSYDYSEFKSMLIFENVMNLEGMAEVSTTNILNSLMSNMKLLDELIPYLELDVPKLSSIGKLNGFNICVTGELYSMNRNQAKELIENNGGKFQSGVSKTTDYLVCNSPSSSSKYKAAMTYGTKIINESDLLNMIK